MPETPPPNSSVGRRSTRTRSVVKAAQPVALDAPLSGSVADAIGATWMQLPPARNAAMGLEHLAALTLELRQGTLFEELPVWLEISCGASRLGDHHSGFTLHTKCVEVQIIIEGGRMKLGSVRRILQQKGKYEEINSRKTRQSNAVGAELSAGFSRSRLNLKGLLAAAGRRGTKIHEQSTGRPEATLLEKQGDSRLVFGERGRGDLLQGEGFLSGVYPRSDPTEKDNPPLFIIQPDDAGRALVITGVALIPAEELEVRSTRRRMKEAERDDLLDDIKTRGDHARADHVADVEKLREQMARRYLIDRLLEYQKRIPQAYFQRGDHCFLRNARGPTNRRR